MSGETRYAFRQGNSFMHTLDPVSKIVWVVSMSFMILVLNVAWIQVILFGVILLIAIILARLTPGFIWRFSRYIYFLGALLFVLQSFFVKGGNVLFHRGPFAVYELGLLIGAAAGLRVINLASASMIFLITTSPRDLAISATEKLGLPARATQALFLALRFLPLLEDEYADLMDAHKVRGAGAGNGLRERARRMQRFTVPYLFSSLRRAQVSALAMDSKAFGAYPTKTFYHQVQYPLRGKIFALLWVLLLLVSIILVATGTITSAGNLRMA
ncbi:MAG: energy-coupling factor transporter transmembrane protein EcfT [Ardenticatenaceae bacterium]|nr:energy-coupling factor transporter transmembrane protein EcfT [Ardenticatenaceae bacterium]